MAHIDSQSGSSILVEECFHAEDDRFLDELRKLRSLKTLAAFADRWKKDPRPWAREQLFGYLDRPLNRPGHHPIVKRLFKHAEETEDHELMAAFLVAFDRSVRRRRKTRFLFHRDSNTWWQEEYLVTPRVSIPAKTTRSVRDPVSGRKVQVPVRIGPDSQLFSVHARYYLRRRAWRYFRRLGYRDPDLYIDGVSSALRRYTDADFAAGENILDNWGLLHICYQGHDALRFNSSKALLVDGRSISELKPGPYFPESWKQPNAYQELLSLVREAPARLVREWSMDLLREDHREGLTRLGPDELLSLIEHEHADVQEFGSELLQSAAGLEKIPLTVWLRLSRTRNPTALAIICDLMRSHVSSERLTMDQMIDLATAAPSPVAELGLGFLKGGSFASAADRAKLARLAEARCTAQGGEIAGFALQFFESEEDYDREVVSEFFDSLLPEVRNRAWNWMRTCRSAYWDPMLWHRLLETPFSDLRRRVVEGLEGHEGGSPASPDDLAPFWISSLMDVHRGARQKLSAIRQIAKAVDDKPERADGLLPLIQVAVRSVRGPEQRAGLAAVVTLVERNPDLAAKIRALLPELIINPVETA